MNPLKVKYIIAGLISAMCMFSSGWVAYHLFYMSLGKGPIEIDEPNAWLARGEFLFAVLIALLGLAGAVYIIIKHRQGKCPLCGSVIHIGKPLPTSAGVFVSGSTGNSSCSCRKAIADAGTGKGAAHVQEN